MDSQKKAKIKNKKFWNDQQKMLEGRKKLEQDYIQNTTWDDVTAEKRALGKAWVTSALITAGSIVAPIPLAVIVAPNSEKIRSRTRIKRYTSK